MRSASRSNNEAKADAGRPPTPDGANALTSLWNAKLTGKREQEVFTPPEITQRLAREWGGIVLDPCSDKGHWIPALRHYTKEGLEADWMDRSYANPEYKSLKEWLSKALEEAKKGFRIALLCPVRCHRRWYREALRHATSVVEFDPVVFYGRHAESGAIGPFVSWDKKAQAWKVSSFPAPLILINFNWIASQSVWEGIGDVRITPTNKGNQVETEKLTPIEQSLQDHLLDAVMQTALEHPDLSFGDLMDQLPNEKDMIQSVIENVPIGRLASSLGAELPNGKKKRGRKAKSKTTNGAAAKGAKPARSARKPPTNKPGATEDSERKTGDGLETAVLSVISASDENVTMGELEEKLEGYSKAQIRRALGKLKEAGKIEQHGERRSTSYSTGGDEADPDSE